MEGVVEVFIVEAFAAGDFARMLRYRLFDAIESSVQSLGDDDRTTLLLSVKKDGAI